MDDKSVKFSWKGLQHLEANSYELQSGVTFVTGKYRSPASFFRRLSMDKGFVTGHGRETTREALRHFIRTVGDDPDREGLKDTPDRVIESWKELFSGYGKDVGDVFKVFDGGNYDQLILCSGIEMYSTCEHHLLPFFGHAHVAYIPRVATPTEPSMIVGLSKLARVVEIYSRRLQVQERLTQEITAALDHFLKPLGSACVIVATHLCMCSRGVGKQHSKMTTSSVTGVFREKPEARAELLQLIHNGG